MKSEKVIEDVLIMVGRFVILINFIILDFKAYNHVLIIMGRPFLAASEAFIDVGKGGLE